MPTCSDAKVLEMVRHLYRVVTPDCATTLDFLKFVVVGHNPIMGTNPGLFINKASKAGLLMILNNVREGDIAITKSDTVVVSRASVGDVPKIYGVLIHEMGHAYCEKTGALPNTEKNAYIFETNWVCRMAADASHPFATAMRQGFKSYFEGRMPSFRGAGVDKLHNGNVASLGLSAYA